MAEPTRPAIPPALVAQLTEGVPGRIRRKLDRDPEQAEGWTWTPTTVAAPKGHTVAFTVEGSTVTGVSCTCLLAPRCLHVLATITRLPIAEEAAEPADPLPEQPAEWPPPSAAQQAAAEALSSAAGAVLEGGVRRTGALRQARLLRAIHTARVQGLHAAASTGVRLITSLRALRDDRAVHDPAALHTDLRVLLSTTARVQAADGSALGRARRTYTPLSGLRLYGLACEPVASASGYAGVVTWLCDADGQVYSIPDLLPGAPQRARSASAGGVGLGDVHASHDTVARTGLLIAAGTASPEGRLGRGQSVRAALAGPTRWSDEPVAALFARPPAAQVQAALDAPDRSVLCLSVHLLGRAGPDLALSLEDGTVVYGRAAPGLHETGKRAFAQLSRLAGHPLQVVGRLHPDADRTLTLLAIRPTTGVELPAALQGQLHPGIDTLGNAAFAGSPGPVVDRLSPPDPLAPAARVLRKVVSGGRDALRWGATDVEHAAAQLARDQLSVGAQLVAALAQQARHTPRDARGAHRPAASDALARSWLQLAVWEAAAAHHLRMASWGASPQ